MFSIMFILCLNVNLIGASLSKPHINSTFVCEFYMVCPCPDELGEVEERGRELQQLQQILGLASYTKQRV